MKYEKMNNLFLRQSYLDSWEDYERSLKKKSFIKWDYIILTASNEAQATAYRNQIENRLEKGLLPEETTYAVLPDPEGKRVGSGGATFQVMRYIADQEPERENPFKNRRILVIHSGGDSKRVPQYSAIGKLFSPVPRELPDGRSSTLFDEFIVGMSGVPSRIQEGMLVLSGDVLLLFNPLQIDAQFDGAAAISIKEPVATGKNHGVFLNDGHDYVKCFLHKQTEERLREMGAVNKAGNVDLDTGAVLFGSALLQALFRLISTGGKVDEKKFRQFCNEEARISFYGDFLYPLANDSTLEDFYKEAAEGQLNEALHECRTQIWNAIHHFSMKLLCLSPAEFIHFGTTRELRSLVTKDVQDYEFLDWKMQVNSAVQKEGFAAHNAYVGSRAKIGKEAYLENCYILGNSEVGDGTVLSHVRIMDRKIPEQIVMHGTELTGGKKVIRIYGVPDNPKGKYPGEVSFLGTTLNQFVAQNKVTKEELWKGEETYLWFADLYPVCDDWEDALDMAEIIYKMAHGTATKEEISRWRETERMSLYSSFNAADIEASCDQERFLENRILARCFIRKLEQGMYYADALKIFGKRGISKEIFKLLMEDAEEADFSLKIRIYHAVSCSSLYSFSYCSSKIYS
jgi:fucokinase